MLPNMETDVKFKIIQAGGLLLILFVALMAGCNHEDYPGQTDEGHIENFILNEDKGVDLFRATNIFPQTPYHWPGNDTLYYDSVMSVNREFDTYISDSSWDYGALGWLYEGVSRVSDIFQVRRFGIMGTDTTFIDESRTLVRAGFFLKLGRDIDYNFGWDLWGMGYFNQNPTEMNVGLWFADSTSMRGGFDLYSQRLIDNNLTGGGQYRELVNFKVIPDSSECRIDVEISNPSIPKRYYTRVSYPVEDGYASLLLTQIDQEHATGTVMLGEHPVPAYDFVVISLYDPATKEFVRAWTAPYRINPIT